VLVDSRADKEDFEKAYGYKLSDPSEAAEADCIVLSVAHKEYRERNLKDWDRYFKSGDNRNKVIIDVKSILDRKEVLAEGYCYWRL
jgi:UDP-N-acetyl-D-galactosamine dehydrogenase